MQGYVWLGEARYGIFILRWQGFHNKRKPSLKASLMNDSYGLIRFQTNKEKEVF